MKFHYLILATCSLATTVHANSEKAIWTNYQGNAAHTGFVDMQTNTTNFKTDWIKKFKGKNESSNQAIVTEKMIYLTIAENNGTENVIHALDAKTGQMLWHLALEKNSAISGLAYGNGKIYFTTVTPYINDRGSLKAYDAQSGSLALNTNLYLNINDIQQPPVIFSNHAYIATRGEQYSVNGLTGAVEWKASGGDGNENITVSPDYIIRSEKTGIVLLSNQNGGNKVWIAGVDTLPDTNHIAPIWDENHRTVYAVMTPFKEDHPQSAQLIAFDTEHQVAKWKLKSETISQPVLANDVLYFASHNVLQEVDALTGKINWRWTAPITNSINRMIATRDIIFVSSYFGNKTYAISRSTHQIIWEIDQFGEMSLGDNHLYLVNGNTSDVTVTAVALR